MPLGISPTVDFAFQKTFGSPENKICLISLLNSILELSSPIVGVTLLNPFNLKDYHEDKLSIVDIKAKDDDGNVFHIEIQLTTPPGLVKRMVFYGCELYSGQMFEGDKYPELRSVYSICLATGTIWPDSKQVHSCFRLADQRSGRILDGMLEIHIFELARYNVQEEQLGTASRLECWLYWLLHAHEYEPDDLLLLFPGRAFQQATHALEIIRKKTEEKEMYDSRVKAAHDYEWRINVARSEGEARGEAKGEAKGEARGKRQGMLFAIQLLQGALGIVEPDEASLKEMNDAELKKMAVELQKRFSSQA